MTREIQGVCKCIDEYVIYVKFVGIFDSSKDIICDNIHNKNKRK